MKKEVTETYCDVCKQEITSINKMPVNVPLSGKTIPIRGNIGGTFYFDKTVSVYCQQPSSCDICINCMLKLMEEARNELCEYKKRSDEKVTGNSIKLNDVLMPNNYIPTGEYRQAEIGEYYLKDFGLADKAKTKTRNKFIILKQYFN
jgi:hypothetical protein